MVGRFMPSGLYFKFKDFWFSSFTRTVLTLIDGVVNKEFKHS